MSVQLFCGDCLDILPTIESESVDAVITDPPYPYVKRDYGHWTQDEWWTLIVDGVIPEVRRILKPTGSAVFILQPNSEKVGKMRPWLFDFLSWVCHEWNMVQDVWWWNFAALPTGVCAPRERGLLRASIKACVWCGPQNCHRNQDAVLWTESKGNIGHRMRSRCLDDDHSLMNRQEYQSGQGVNKYNVSRAAVERGGVTAFNLLPITRGGDHKGYGQHPGATPLELCDWWTRYIVPPGGTVLDPFVGSGTMMIAAIENGCNGIGIEKSADYTEIAQQRIEKAQSEIVQARMNL